ncbi:hypothetical protein PBRA_001045 [Plasmodiophora brassicae]|uniref:Uncharacterized protein n=1 Tax=Plasmodiophora brassicae TaxID=37360 RepID=A0A0G4IV47_PLABS|nr:hypothetical protein PBRA_001045 [Plasmodiophora brassicae]
MDIDVSADVKSLDEEIDLANKVLQAGVGLAGPGDETDLADADFIDSMNAYLSSLRAAPAAT